MYMKTLFINQREIPITVRKSAKARNLRIKIYSEDGKVELIVPRFAMKFDINRFLKKQAPWITKNLIKIEENILKRPMPKYENGDTFYYFGEPVILIVRSSEKKRPLVRIRKDKMIINLFHTISKVERKKIIKKSIEEFYKKKASEAIHDRLEHFSEYYGFKYNRVTFRNQKTRWGSCSSTKNLNFNWRLIMAPIEVIDYVVIHEMCHLKQMNHSSKFWNLVAEQVPNYKELKKWLKENHYLLRL